MFTLFLWILKTTSGCD